MCCESKLRATWILCFLSITIYPGVCQDYIVICDNDSFEVNQVKTLRATLNADKLNGIDNCGLSLVTEVYFIVKYPNGTEQTICTLDYPACDTSFKPENAEQQCRCESTGSTNTYELNFYFREAYIGANLSIDTDCIPDKARFDSQPCYNLAPVPAGCKFCEFRSDCIGPYWQYWLCILMILALVCGPVIFVVIILCRCNVKNHWCGALIFCECECCTCCSCRCCCQPWIKLWERNNHVQPVPNNPTDPVLNAAQPADKQNTEMETILKPDQEGKQPGSRPLPQPSHPSPRLAPLNGASKHEKKVDALPPINK